MFDHSYVSKGWGLVCRIALMSLWLGIGGACADGRFQANAVIRIDCTHPLCFSIYDNAVYTFARYPWWDLAGKLRDSVMSETLVLVGEVHDNDWAHAFQEELTPKPPYLRKSRAGPGLVFEHIRVDQQGGLDEFGRYDDRAQGRRFGTAADLFRFLDWDKSGWPDKAKFEPLFKAVIESELPIYAGDPPRADIKRIAKEGEGALPEAERQRLGLDRPFPAAAQETLLDDLEKSHCGLMPKTAFTKLAYAQRYRDAYLADVVLKAASEHGSAILFAGNGHVRADRGVPYYLRQRAPAKKIVTVMLIEVEDGKYDPEAYDIKGADGQPLADFIVFTPRQWRPDPCEEMKKSFGKKS